jgi:hypothetical protein
MKTRMLLLAGVAALAPAAVGMTQAAATVQPAEVAFAPPATPMIMTRTLIRTLADGKQVIVTRRFSIRFTPEGGGYRLDGEQIGAEVAAPPALAALAEIERKRVEKGLFPARLDAQGMILSSSPSRDPETNHAAVMQGERIIAAAAIPPDAKRERSVVLGQVASSATGSAWPTFLFNPGSQERVERRKLTLPSGGEGEVEVRIAVQGLMACGLPLAIERIVTTRLSGTSRVTREVWTFAASPA